MWSINWTAPLPGATSPSPTFHSPTPSAARRGPGFPSKNPAVAIRKRWKASCSALWSPPPFGDRWLKSPRNDSPSARPGVRKPFESTKPSQVILPPDSVSPTTRNMRAAPRDADPHHGDCADGRLRHARHQPAPRQFKPAGCRTPGVQGRLLHSSTFLRPGLAFGNGYPQSVPASMTWPQSGRIAGIALGDAEDIAVRSGEDVLDGFRPLRAGLRQPHVPRAHPDTPVRSCRAVSHFHSRLETDRTACLVKGPDRRRPETFACRLAGGGAYPQGRCRQSAWRDMSPARS